MLMLWTGSSAPMPAGRPLSYLLPGAARMGQVGVVDQHAGGRGIDLGPNPPDLLLAAQIGRHRPGRSRRAPRSAEPPTRPVAQAPGYDQVPPVGRHPPYAALMPDEAPVTITRLGSVPPIRGLCSPGPPACQLIRPEHRHTAIERASASAPL
jgi:hypothetical protein